MTELATWKNVKKTQLYLRPFIAPQRDIRQDSIKRTVLVKFRGRCGSGLGEAGKVDLRAYEQCAEPEGLRRRRRYGNGVLQNAVRLGVVLSTHILSLSTSHRRAPHWQARGLNETETHVAVKSTFSTYGLAATTDSSAPRPELLAW